MMPRSLEDIAREIADIAVSTAQCAGYDIASKRALFFRSDLGKLEDEILTWLQEHMTPEPADED